MVVGVPKEIKVGEQRIALTPAGARAFSDAGHHVLVETGAGVGSSFRDEEIAAAGAGLVDIGEVGGHAVAVLNGKGAVAGGAGSTPGCPHPLTQCGPRAR